MKGLLSFSKGGIRIYDYKELTNNQAIRNAHIPAISIIPLLQHKGQPASCLVNTGDTLFEGMLIGKAVDSFSANIHSPVPGRVIGLKEIILPDGKMCKAVVVACEGEFSRSGKIIPKLI